VLFGKWRDGKAQIALSRLTGTEGIARSIPPHEAPHFFNTFAEFALCLEPKEITYDRYCVGAGSVEREKERKKDTEVGLGLGYQGCCHFSRL
jgi:hypothetical protein